MYKKISFRSVPKPGRETAPGFSLRGRGAPQKRLWFFEASTSEPQTQSVFWPPPPRTPKSQNQQRSEENTPMSERPKRKSGRPAAGLAQPRDEHGAEPARGRGGKHRQACRPAGRGGQRGRHPHFLRFVEAVNHACCRPCYWPVRGAAG